MAVHVSVRDVLFSRGNDGLDAPHRDVRRPAFLLYAGALVPGRLGHVERRDPLVGRVANVQLLLDSIRVTSDAPVVEQQGAFLDAGVEREALDAQGARLAATQNLYGHLDFLDVSGDLPDDLYSTLFEIGVSKAEHIARGRFVCAVVISGLVEAVAAAVR